MKKKRQLIVKLILLLVFGWLFVTFVDVSEVLSNLAKLTWVTLSLIVFLEFAFIFVEALKVYLVAERKIPYRLLVKTRLLGKFANIFLPGSFSGDVLRSWIIKSQSEVSFTKAIMLLLAGRAYGLLGLAVLFGGFCFISSGEIVTSLGVSAPSAGIIALLICLIPLLLNLRNFRRLCTMMIRRSPFARLRTILRKAYFALYKCGRPSLWGVALILSAVSSAILAYEFTLLSDNFLMDLDIQFWVFALTIMTFALLIPIGLGGVGTQDISLVFAGSLVGQTPEMMVAVSLCIHGMRVVTSLPGAFFLSDLTEASKALMRSKSRKSI